MWSNASLGVLSQHYAPKYHLDPFWHSHHNDNGRCDGVTASEWTESAFHWGPAGMAALGVDFQMLFMLLAGPARQTDLPGGNAYSAVWPMLNSTLPLLTPGSYDGVDGDAQVSTIVSR